MSDQEAPPIPRPIRRPHGKSKTGCHDCQRRRVKCSEERPSCRQCVRPSVCCQYPNQLARASTTSPSTSIPALPDSPGKFRFSQSPSRESEPTPKTTLFDLLDHASSAELRLSDLRLFHHWILSPSLDMSKWPKDCYIWQAILPQIGFQYTFVLHAMMGLAALHIVSNDTPEKKSMWMAGVYHYSQALRCFQKEIANITEQNSEALFMWLVCNIMYTFAMSNPLRQAPDAVILGAEFIPIIRGVDAVLVPSHNFI
ncbi:uncharacterized protein FOBCDRAFT_186971 [Fusarium oxysporum Fo47]|uniref:uncharacterized protein n=1 Tax=Fusarium oxysporum Fo47 TaxID=660027 RepID=UPI002869B943|nr:uncharacterized protein FOBCDRAFT_186971 [Fusarium oxysporum Fo47]QKD57893.2 hypothetical protein FOBCDRAFT_186971 [Fusarium oxysporum Fo47]